VAHQEKIDVDWASALSALPPTNQPIKRKEIKMKQQIIWTHELVEALDNASLPYDYLCNRAINIWGKGADYAIGQLIEEQMVGFLSDPSQNWVTIPSYAKWGGRFWVGDRDVSKSGSTRRREFLDRILAQPNRRVALPLIGD
jgi:hypothetical protein